MRLIYIFYADIYLLQNFFMDYIAMVFVNCFLKRGKSLKRMALLSFLASVTSLLLHIMIANAGLRTIILHFGLNMAMALLAFGWSGRKALLENWLVIYLAILFLGGIMEWEERLGLPASFFWMKALLAAVVLSVTCAYLSQKRMFLERIYQVEILHGGKKYAFAAYWDSGNLLVDPYIGEPVNIIGNKAAQRMFAGQDIPMRLIPYRSLGNENGLLTVCNVQAMWIYQGKKKKEIHPVVLGIAKEGLLEGKEYDVILQASLIEGEFECL